MQVCSIQITNWRGCSGALLNDEPFYHGYMSREESERLVRTQGEFLLRKTELTRRGEVVVLSVFWDEAAHHLVVEKANNGLFYLKEFCFEVRHFRKCAPLNKVSEHQ